MKPTCIANTTELASSAKLNTYVYNFQTCGFAFGEPFGVHQTIKIKIIY